MSGTVMIDESGTGNLTGYTEIRHLRKLTEPEWRRLRERHESRVDNLLDDYMERRSRHERNPVLDFLFEYYSFRPSILRRWVPGTGVLLEVRDATEFSGQEAFQIVDGGVAVNRLAFPEHRVNSIKWILELLRVTDARPPRLGCYGLHEWAMVYRTDDIRHPYLPLRLSEKEITAFVDSRQIVCSHFDAHRFFTKQARPLNQLQPKHDNRMEFEQPGCVHVTMDLYKWAYKIYPWINSDLIADAFELAVQARKVDMQASPYDMREFDLPPIRIETDEGRVEYSNEQRRLASLAEPIRKRLIRVYEELLGYQEDHL